MVLSRMVMPPVLSNAELTDPSTVRTKLMEFANLSPLFSATVNVIVARPDREPLGMI